MAGHQQRGFLLAEGDMSVEVSLLSEGPAAKVARQQIGALDSVYLLDMNI